MEEIRKSAKTVDDAIAAALAELGAAREEVDITVIDEGSKGFLGMFGSKDAVVLVKKNFNPEKEAETFLKEVFLSMGLIVKIKTEQKDKHLYIDLTGDDMGILIGKRGQTLDALQYLVNLVVNKKSPYYISVMLDTENYRQRRKETLESLAFNLAKKVKHTKRNVVLEPMNPYERRIIHSAVAKVEGVNSKSVGEEPYRKVVISPDHPKKNDVKKNGGYKKKRNDGPRSLDLKTSFEKDYKKPKPEDDINAGLYGKIEL